MKLYQRYPLIFLFLIVLLLFPILVNAQGPDDPLPFKVYLPLVLSSPGQLLLNPSFEDAPDGIEPWRWLSPQINYSLGSDSQIVHHQQQYLAVNRQTTNFGNKSFYQDVFPPEAGKTYRFAIWVRASDAAVSANKPRTGRLALWAFGGNPSREHGTHNFQVSDTNWHCTETWLTVKQTGHVTLRVEVYLTSLDGFDYFFDEAILYEGNSPICPPAPPDVMVNTGQGFDACAAPSTGALNAWKQASPYQYLGIYLGGANHYTPCRLYNEQNQTPTWYNTVSQQGWKFIPIWVGPQAACTGYTTRMSYDPTTARNEGILEAQQALVAAANLGLAQPTIIYYDLEYYPTTDLACHNAANAFLEGWVSQIQNQGHKAGIYGSVYAVNDWYLLRHVPDSVWVARYIGSGYDPAMTIDPLNQGWITESYWENHRLFQYSGGHNETWGGYVINVDNDTARGLVALSEVTPQLKDMQWLSQDQGWLRVDDKLWWTDDGGDRWANISPPSDSGLMTAFFLDAKLGWAVTSGLQMWRTDDGGQSWQPVNLKVRTDLPIEATHIEFADARNGWLSVQLATGVPFSQGILLKTGDGGQSWQQTELPVGGLARFINGDVGWLVGGPTQSELYLTRDGGQSWQPQSPVSFDPAREFVTYGLPTVISPDEVVVPVTRYQAGQSRVEFYAGVDKGQSWELTGAETLKQSLSPGVQLLTSIFSRSQWLIAETHPDFIKLSMTTPLSGWALSRKYVCNGGCRMEDKLLRTHNGGTTWVETATP